MSAPGARRPGQHGPSPFSGRTRRRVLAALRDKALAGDPTAAEVLLRLGQQAVSERAPILSARSAVD
jgi:hypothetical protein